jgi:hypothetical protein
LAAFVGSTYWYFGECPNGRSLISQQSENELRPWKPAQAESTDFENWRIEIADEIFRHEQVAVELATKPLNAARQIDVRTDHCEIKSVIRSYVAIRDLAVVERAPSLKVTRRDR